MLCFQTICNSFDFLSTTFILTFCGNLIPFEIFIHNNPVKTFSGFRIFLVV